MNWFKLRYELIRDYPGCPFDVESILDVNGLDGKIYLDQDKSISPNQFKDHFRLLRWWEHRTIEQLLSLKYMKIVSGSNYYIKGDIVEVSAIHYNDASFVGGRDNILFDLKGHHFIVSQLEPSTKNEYEKWDAKDKNTKLL